MLPALNVDFSSGVTTGIVVANHQHEGDWWFMLMVARYLGLHGNVKILVKEQLKSVPLLGWVLQLAEYPCIAESWSKCRTDLLSLLRSFTADAFPVLLFQFPEGDRIDSNIRQQSMSFAQKERRPQLLHVVLPRTTGFNTCIEALR
jgi:1-acyl-sn-glycerol-3-phosphate acyltransferase